MRRFAVGILMLLTVACSHDVTIPPAGQDTAPTITINAFVVQQPSGYSGDIEPGRANVGMTSSVNVTEGAKVQFSGSAKNPGGVQQFTVTVKQSGQTLYQVSTTGVPDANGQVPDLLSLVGTNGAGGSGNQPMVVTMSTPVIVTTTATNFHAMSQTITITYNPVSTSITVGGGGSSTPPPPPSSAQLFLSATHDLGPFQTTTAPPGFCQATLTWTVTPVSLTGTTGVTTPFTTTVTANPAPTWLQDPSSGLYSARCPYGQMVGNLKPGTWMVSINANGAGGTWQAQCQAMLAAGMNGRTFRWNQPGCQ
jgi:hypothetical protein